MKRTVSSAFLSSSSSEEEALAVPVSVSTTRKRKPAVRNKKRNASAVPPQSCRQAHPNGNGALSSSDSEDESSRCGRRSGINSTTLAPTKKPVSIKKKLSYAIPVYDDDSLEEELQCRRPSLSTRQHVQSCPPPATACSVNKTGKEEEDSDSEREEDDFRLDNSLEQHDLPVSSKAVSKQQQAHPKANCGPTVSPAHTGPWWSDWMTREPSLEQIQKMVSEVSATSSRNQKLEILSRHPCCVKILLYVHNPFWQYYIRPVRVKKTLQDKTWRSPAGRTVPSSIFALLDILKSRTATGNEALNLTCSFVKQSCNSYASAARQKGIEQLIYSILDRNLKIRCATPSINNVFPGLIPTFPVALAEDVADVPASTVDYVKDTWWALRKFDGVRVIAFVKSGTVEFRSRLGNTFVTLTVIENLINGLGLPADQDIVLDGELCIFENGKEDFQRAVGEIKRKSGFLSNPRYVLFDCLTFEEFQSGSSSVTYSARLVRLKKLFQDKIIEPYLTTVECIHVKDEAHLALLSESAERQEWEGLIIRKEAGYVGKRSTDMLKVKKFKDAEFPCTGMTLGKMRIHLDGKEKELETMSSITIDFDGNAVRVGSGFTPEQREHYKSHANQIVGKLVCVKYFEVSQDRTGKRSLRFPTFKGVYGKERQG